MVGQSDDVVTGSWQMGTWISVPGLDRESFGLTYTLGTISISRGLKQSAEGSRQSRDNSAMGWLLKYLVYACSHPVNGSVLSSVGGKCGYCRGKVGDNHSTELEALGYHRNGSQKCKNTIPTAWHQGLKGQSIIASRVLPTWSSLHSHEHNPVPMVISLFLWSSPHFHGDLPVPVIISPFLWSLPHFHYHCPAPTQAAFPFSTLMWVEPMSGAWRNQGPRHIPQ